MVYSQGSVHAPFSTSQNVVSFIKEYPKSRTCWHTATEEADFGEIGIRVNFRDTGFVADGVLAES
jgi:hypothetical protein